MGHVPLTFAISNNIVSYMFFLPLNNMLAAEVSLTHVTAFLCPLSVNIFFPDTTLYIIIHVSCDPVTS